MKRGLLVLVALLSGCGCTQVGCANLVRFTVPVDLQPGVDYRIQGCVVDDCAIETLTVTDGTTASAGSITIYVDDDAVELMLGDGDFTNAPPDLQLSVFDGDVALAEFSGPVEMTLNRPNGAFCGPTCYFAEADASAVE
jgi:hypothetical protein